MAEIVGLDFGTTNSLVSFVLGDRAIALTDKANGDLPHPSVVWFHGRDVIVGRRAETQLGADEDGFAAGIVRSPKAYLGRGESPIISGVQHQASDVVAELY